MGPTACKLTGGRLGSCWGTAGCCGSLGWMVTACERCAGSCGTVGTDGGSCLIRADMGLGVRVGAGGRGT